MKTTLFLTILIFSLTTLAAPAPEAGAPAPDYQTCAFESPDVGKMKFRGTSREEAFEKTARACLQARVETYIRARGDVPTVERKILFAEDCVNKTYCKH